MRKLVNMIQKAEMDFHHGCFVDFQPLDELVHAVLDLFLERQVGNLPEKAPSFDSGQSESQLRYLNQWRHFLMNYLDIQTAEWDLVLPETGELDQGQVKQLPMAVFLEDIRSPFNVGSIFRTAHCFGVETIFLSPMTPSPDHPRAKRTARGCESLIHWKRAALEELAGETAIFALETGGQSLNDFCFPEKGLVLVGSEELGLSPEALALADKGQGRISIPMLGAKRSLNVSVAFGVLMHAWMDALVQKK